VRRGDSGSMIVHIIEKGAYAKDFTRFVEREYQELVQYVFVINREEKVDSISFEGGCQTEINLNHLEIFTKYSRKADRIIIHGLFDFELFLWIWRHPFLWKKMVLSIWGGELYIHQEIWGNHKTKIRSKVFDLFRGATFRRFHLFLNDMEEDFPLLKKWYGVSGRSIHVIYPPSIPKELLESIIAYKKKRDERAHITILLGNSATPSNQHIEVIRLLEKYRDRNLRILCPLSYGDSDYAKHVAKYGKEVFGKKFRALTKLLPSDEYAQAISQVDVAIFNNNRQQAMANIAMTAMMGCKVYLRKDTVMWDQYVEKGLCGFSDIMRIEGFSWEEFIENKPEDVQRNISYFGKLWDMKHLKKMWDKILLD